MAASAAHTIEPTEQLQEEKAERWRQTAARVAIASLPIVGDVAGRTLFGAVMRRGGCLGCGCLPGLAILAVAIAGAAALLR